MPPPNLPWQHGASLLGAKLAIQRDTPAFGVRACHGLRDRGGLG